MTIATCNVSSSYRLGAVDDKQMFLNAKLKPGKRCKKNRGDWEKSVKEAKVHIGLQCHLRR
jgi:hypothetical protein